MGAMPDRLGDLLVHPLRHRLLLEYTSGPDSPGRIAKRLGKPVNVVAYHTAVLRRHGVIELVRTERRRGVLSRWYRSTVDPVIDAAHWESLPLPLRRELSVATLEQVTDESRRALAGGGFDHPGAHVSRFPLELDRQGADDLAALLREADAAFAAIAAGSRERANADRVAYELVILRFEPAARAD
jgi:DNA-binding transcriptional ArsR family regulator